MIQGREQELE